MKKHKTVGDRERSIVVSYEKEKAERRNKRMMFLILAVYAPLTIVLAAKFNIMSVSLSRIGWIEGQIGYLAFYVTATAALIITQARTFLKQTNQKSKLFTALIIIGAVLLVVGSVIPVGTSLPILSKLHCYLCQAGSVIVMLAITLMVAAHCRQHSVNVRKAAFAYACVIAAVAVMFAVFYTAALFELASSLLFMTVMHVVNSSAFYAKNRNEKHHAAIAASKPETLDAAA